MKSRTGRGGGKIFERGDSKKFIGVHRLWKTKLFREMIYQMESKLFNYHHTKVLAEFFSEKINNHKRF